MPRYRFFALVLLVLPMLGGACKSNEENETQSSPAPVVAAQEGLCGEHGLPEALCTKCNPALAAVFKARGDWCSEHDVPESICPTCSPGAAAKAAAAFGPGGSPVDAPVADWCPEHGLPESKCTKCNASLTAQFQAAGDWCDAHGFPESVCPKCNPQAPPASATGDAAIESKTVRLRSPDLEATAGIETVTAKPTQAAASIECTAQIAFHGDRVADVRAIVPGVVRRVRAELGASVKKGAPLFELESTHVGQIQGTLATARQRVSTAKANLARQQELVASSIGSTRNLELAQQELAAAQAEAKAAEATLRMAGAAEAASSGRYILTAPIDGVVVRRPGVMGVLATESTSLATIADTSVMWALCNVPEADAARLELGQVARVTVAGNGGKTIPGTVTWIAAEVDARTRTVTARAEVPNADGKLRANQFARAQIETGAPRTAVSVPRAAVQRVGEREVVFVRTAAGVYEPRVVRRYGDGETVQVEGNVREGDAIVTTGAVLLRTEIMPGSIGAGCCEAEAPGDG